MKALRFTIIILVVPLLICCKKEKLDGDSTEKLVGVWKWLKTEKTIGFQTTVVSSGYDTEIDFLEKGILKIRKNGKCKDRYRIKGVDEAFITDNVTSFSFDISKDSDGVSFTLRESESTDTLESLRDSDFFYLDINGSPQEQVLHYFVRE